MIEGEGTMTNFDIIGFSDLEFIGTSSSSVYEYSTKSPPQTSQYEDPKVELCWSTHNYESVTTLAPELIQPKLTLGFIK